MHRALSIVWLVLLAPSAGRAQEPAAALLERARRLLEQAPLIDTHNDLPSMLLDERGGDLTGLDLGTVQAGLCADVADHIDHVRQLAGVDHVGIGSDFYDAGTGSMAVGLENVSRYPYLFAELLRRGYSDEDILKIAGRNHLRAMREMERVAAELQKIEPPLTTELPAGESAP
jgi:hypothetical protein